MIKDLSGQIEIEIVTTEDQLRQLIQALAQAEFVAIDTETTSLNCGKDCWYTTSNQWQKSLVHSNRTRTTAAGRSIRTSDSI